MRARRSAIRQRLLPLCPCVWKVRTQFLHFQNKQSSIGVCFRDHLVTKLRCSYKNLTRIPIAKIVAFTSKYGLYNRAMNLVLDGHTAMDFWRWVYPVGKTPDAKDCLHIQSLSSIDTANTQKDVQGLRPGWLTDRFLDMGPGRIGTLAGRPQERRRSPGALRSLVELESSRRLALRLRKRRARPFSGVHVPADGVCLQPAGAHRLRGRALRALLVRPFVQTRFEGAARSACNASGVIAIRSGI